MTRLGGKRIYITGGAGGIGRATAEACIAEGARVFLTDASDEVMRVAEEVGAVGASVTDVTDPEAVTSSVGQAVLALGGLDAMHLNAGIEGQVASLEALDLADFRKVMEVNLYGVLHGLRAGLPHLEAGTGASVVMTSSVAGLSGSAGLGPYCVSKHAVIGLMRTAAQELGPKGIRVNTVNPGPIDNRMMTSIEHRVAPGGEAEVRSGLSARVPLSRYGRNEEVAAMVAFLVSDAASYCNGHTFLVDGGMRSG